VKFKILFYNIHKGFSPLGRLFLIEHIKKVIRASESDIVFLQEVQELERRIFKNENGKELESKLEFLADSVWTHYAYGKNAVYPRGHHGNAILTKYPILSWENSSLTLHKLEHRGLLHSVVELEGKKVHLFNTHINLLGWHRDRQVNMIAETIRSKVQTHEPFILCGDFNDWSQRVSAQITGPLDCKEAFLSKQGEYAKTFPSIWPVLCLDRVYYRNLNVTSCIVLAHDRHSDHLAIQVGFEI
jgi:endonuclease/exonuclease/phosphatase family metal-dependent hydrolase